MKSSVYEAANYKLGSKTTVCEITNDPPTGSISLSWEVNKYEDVHHFLNDGYDDVDEYKLVEMATYLGVLSGLINEYKQGFLDKTEMQSKFTNLLGIIDEDTNNNGS